MGLFNLFKKKPVHEKMKGDIAAKAGCKPIATLQVIEGFNAMYVYLIDNECIVYEIGKHDCSNIYIYESASLARQGAVDTIDYYRQKMDCIVIEHDQSNAQSSPQEPQPTHNKETAHISENNSMLAELGISDTAKK